MNNLLMVPRMPYTKTLEAFRTVEYIARKVSFNTGSGQSGFKNWNHNLVPFLLFDRSSGHGVFHGLEYRGVESVPGVIFGEKVRTQGVGEVFRLSTEM